MFSSFKHRTSRPERRSASGERGYVLIIAIWITGLLSVLMLTFGDVVRSRTRGVAVDTDVAAAEGLADAGVTLATIDIFGASSDAGAIRRITADTPYRCTVGSGEIAVTARDVAGLVDINFATEPLLKALLMGMGLDSERANQIAAAIADYRDTDDVTRPGGAEANEYARAGLSWRPNNAPFSSVHELGRVFGLDARTLKLLLPFVTAHSELTGIEPAKADPRLVDLIISGARSDWTFASSPTNPTSEDDPALLGLPARFSAVSTNKAWLVISEARAGRARFARQAIVQATPSQGRPYKVASWEKVDAGRFGPVGMNDMPPCSRQ